MSPDHDAPAVDGDVYVSPRHLARSTSSGDPALTPLRALGWELEDDDLGNVYLNAPDRRVRLGYLPEGDDDGLWRINAYKDPFGPPTWGACFNDNCPTEFVTAFTTALATAYQQGPESYLARPVAGSNDRDPFLAVTPLLKNDWMFDRPRWGVLAIQSPDGLANFEYTTGTLRLDDELTSRDARWHLWTGTSIDHPYWYATATTDTPVALLKALTETVCAPAPLPRWRAETHTYVRGKAQLTPILPPAPTPLEIQRAAARRPAVLPAASVPRWSTSSRPALPGPRR